MLNLLLEGEAKPGFDTNSLIMLAIVAVLIVVIIVFYVFSSKKRKKQEQDAQDLINAVKPGNKVKTIGGICGIVVEVDNEENTFVLETGTETSGKSYMKFDRQAIYQTDAVVEKKEPETKKDESADGEVKVEENKEEIVAPAAEPVTETPAVAEESVANSMDAQEKTEEKPVKKSGGKSKKTTKPAQE